MPYIRRDPFVLQLWMLGFEYVSQTRRAHVFQRGDGRIAVPKVEHLDGQWARGQLGRCGVAEEKIERTLRAA